MTQINQLRNNSNGNLSKERALSNLRILFANSVLKYADYENVKNTFLLAIKIIQEAVNHKGSACFYDDTYYGDGCIKSLLDILLSKYKTDLEILVVHDGFNFLTDIKISITGALCILFGQLILMTAIMCVILIGVIYIFIMPICVFLAFYLTFCGYRCTNYSQHSKIFRNFIKTRYVFSKNYKSITHCENSQAKVIYTNGDKYEGGWLNGQPHGDGSYTFCNHDEIQVIQGEWLNGDTTVMTVKYHDNRQYTGQLRGDQPHGVGCFSIDCNYAINEVQYYFYGMDFNSFIVSIVQNKLYDLITPDILYRIVHKSAFIKYIQEHDQLHYDKIKEQCFSIIILRCAINTDSWSAEENKIYFQMIENLVASEALYIQINKYQFTTTSSDLSSVSSEGEKIEPDPKIFITRKGNSEACSLFKVDDYLSWMTQYFCASFSGNNNISSPLCDSGSRADHNFQDINQLPNNQLVFDVIAHSEYQLVKSFNGYQLRLSESIN